MRHELKLKHKLQSHHVDALVMRENIMEPIKRAQASIIDKIYIPKRSRNVIKFIIENGEIKMSYRDENQELETPIQQMLDGIKTFNERVNKRIESDSWQTGHILKLNRIRKQLLDIQLDLEEVKRETW